MNKVAIYSFISFCLLSSPSINAQKNRVLTSYEVPEKHFELDTSIFELTKEDSLAIYSFIVRNKYYLYSHVRSRFKNGDSSSIWEILPNYILAYNGLVDTTISPKIIELREENHKLGFESIKLYQLLDILECEAVLVGSIQEEFFVYDYNKKPRGSNSLVELNIEEVIYSRFPISEGSQIVFRNSHNTITGSWLVNDSIRRYSYSVTYEANYLPGEKVIVFLNRKGDVARALNYKSQGNYLSSSDTWDIFDPNIFRCQFGTATDRKYLTSEPILQNASFIDDLRKLCSEGEINETLLWNSLK